MSDTVKWLIMAAGIALLIVPAVAVLTISPPQAIAWMSSAVTQIVSIISPYAYKARSLVNFFVLPQAIPLVTYAIGLYLVGSLSLRYVKITQGIYTWIFK